MLEACNISWTSCTSPERQRLLAVLNLMPFKLAEIVARLRLAGRLSLSGVLDVSHVCVTFSGLL